jgi:hypothetical protein
MYHFAAPSSEWTNRVCASRNSADSFAYFPRRVSPQRFLIYLLFRFEVAALLSRPLSRPPKVRPRMTGMCQSRISGFSSLANFEDPLDLDSKVEGQGRDADRKPRVTAGFTEDFDQKLGSPVQDHRVLGKVRCCVHETTDLDAADHSIKIAAASLL